MGSKERSLVIISCMDYATCASATFPSSICDIKSECLKKHSVKDTKHNVNTIKCKLRSFESLEENYNQQVKGLGYDNTHNNYQFLQS